MVPNFKFILLATVTTHLTTFVSPVKGQLADDSEGSESLVLGPSKFVAPGMFPTSVYKSYFNSPTKISEQPQPVVSDPIFESIYPYSLTNPSTVPSIDTQDPHPLPTTAPSEQILAQAISQIEFIRDSPVFANSTCQQCLVSLEIAKFLALAAPDQGPSLAVEICNIFKISSSPTVCNETYGAFALGGIFTQVFANMNVGNYDGQAFCAQFLNSCPQPTTSPLNLTGWFAKPKPNPLPPPRKSNGRRLKVLHMSDFHIDTRYATGSEANCTSGLCCRIGNANTQSPNRTVLPAPRYGSFLCDTPEYLALAALEAIPELTGTVESGFDFTVFTGDVVSHDGPNQLSRGIVEETETLLYTLFREMLGSGPLYVTMGNHDSYNQAQDAPQNLPAPLGNQFKWNYDHVADLWAMLGWVSPVSAARARRHYAAFSVEVVKGFRVISLNTNLWYRANYFNYVNFTNPDNSRMLRYLTDELQAAEDAGERVWIIGHVLSGWDGSNPLLNPTNLFYQIVERYSPHVIANIFFGHTHEDQFSIFYANNGTNMSAGTALAVSWIAPSITPLTNLNSGFRMYEVDAETFDILDAHTWFSNVSTYPELDGQTRVGPTFQYEYSTREAYGKPINWPPTAALNATFWHKVTEEMQKNISLVEMFNAFQGKMSVLSPPCNTTECAEARICYMRSGSAPLALEKCQSGFGSVQ